MRINVRFVLLQQRIGLAEEVRFLSAQALQLREIRVVAEQVIQQFAGHAEVFRSTDFDLTEQIFVVSIDGQQAINIAEEIPNGLLT